MIAGMSSDSRLTDLLGLLFTAHPWHGIPARPSEEPDTVNAYIEIVPSDAVKYELDKATGHLHIDRPQRFSSQCPTMYGFIPQTYCGDSVAARAQEEVQGDGDPLDICVITEKSIAHGVILKAKPIGGLRMIDGNQADDKIIAVLEKDVTFGHLRELSECPPGVLTRLEHYFLSYKQMPDGTARKVHIAERYGRSEALAVVQASLRDYRERWGAPESRLDEVKALLLKR
jgi:inorganic pyrophosphatase